MAIGMLMDNGKVGSLKFGGCPSGDTPTGEAPVNTVQPSFAAPQVGENVTTSNGEWESETPITYTYQWQLDGGSLLGANEQSIVYVSEMVGRVLSCIVTATNLYGFAVATAYQVVGYIARTDGISQQWNLSSPIQTSAGDYFTFGLSVSSNAGSFGNFKRIIGSDSNYTMTVGINSGTNAGEFIIALSSFVFDGIPRTSGNAILYGVGVLEAKFTPQEPTSIQAIGGLATLTGRSCSAAFKNFRHYNLSGELLHEIPLNDREQGGVQSATVGSINATMINYSEDVWEIDG